MTSSTEPVIKRGDRVRRRNPPLEHAYRVMAVADGYAMMRYPHCIPFCEPIGNLVLVDDE